ncbi:MAG: hypothetical protein NTX09_12360, partial [Verrucomicrobia bacterium]|nr:hypothetical protein [Verrucomicrobiota bacterium]
AQKIQTVICRVAASTSQWRSVRSLALAVTEKSSVQSTLVLATALRWGFSAIVQPEPTGLMDSRRR